MKVLPFIACLLAVTAGAPQPHDHSEHILMGTDALPGQFPYQVSLQTLKGFHFCGGSIINNYWILSAAHCAEDIEANRTKIIVGNTDYKKGHAYSVATIICHQDYNPVNLANDISLWKTVEPIQFNKNVQMIDLAQDYVPGALKVVSSGWGDTSFPFGDSPKYLQFIRLKTLTVDECKKEAKDISYLVRESVLCVERKTGTGMCKGDSGGPLAMNGQLVGVVSFGKPCGLNYPDGFTRVSSYIDWIGEIVDKN